MGFTAPLPNDQTKLTDSGSLLNWARVAPKKGLDPAYLATAKIFA